MWVKETNPGRGQDEDEGWEDETLVLVLDPPLRPRKS